MKRATAIIDDCVGSNSSGLKRLYSHALPSTRGGALFGAFPYPTKISPEVIATYIAAHTKPGETVFDGFAGSGTTGVAALLCGRPTPGMRETVERLGLRVEWGARNAILYELGVLGAFVGKTLTNPPASRAFRTAAGNLLSQAESQLAGLYAAKDPDGLAGAIRYVIWSDVLICPSCRKTATLWDGCVSRTPARIASEFTCPTCAERQPLSEMPRATVTEHDPVLGTSVTVRKRKPVWVYGSTGRRKWSRAAMPADLAHSKVGLEDVDGAPIPEVKIPWGDLYRSGYHQGITHLHQLYTRRNLLVFARLWELTKGYEDPIRDALRFWLLSYNGSHATIMTRVVAKKGQRDLALTSAQPGVLYVSGLPVEKNLLSGLRRKLSTIAEAFEVVEGCGGKVEVINRSSCDLDLADGAIDYIFTDPPFGGNIPYAEINFINEAWLGAYTDRKDEAIVSADQKKGVKEYQDLLTSAFREARRVLKPDGKVTVVFHSATADIWKALQAAYTDAGFAVEEASVLDKTQGSFKQVTTTGAVRGDPVLMLGAGDVSLASIGDSVWQVAERLKREAAHAKDPEEQSAQRLYSRLVTHYLSLHQQVPLDADEFYRWHSGWTPIGGQADVEG